MMVSLGFAQVERLARADEVALASTLSGDVR